MLLRAATEADRGWILGLMGLPPVAAMLSRTAVEDADAALTRVLEGATDEGVVVLADTDGTRRGTARWVRRHRVSRIYVLRGVAVDPATQGRGLGLELVTRLSQLLLDEHDAHRLEAETLDSNLVAQRLFTRAGYVEEGRLRQAYDRRGAWHDGVMLGLVRDSPPRSTDEDDRCARKVR